MNIRVSRRRLRRIKRSGMSLIVVLAATFGLFGLGRSSTLRTVEGRPLLYSPAVRATEKYRVQVVAWVDQFKQLDHDLTGLLETSGDLYEQSIRANGALDQATRLAQEIEFTSAPTVLAELRQIMQPVSQSYLTAAQAAATLINAPTPENQQAAAQTSEQARLALDGVQQSRWLTSVTGTVK